MAQCTLTPQEFIQNSFSPNIGALCSNLADTVCRKNNLSFVELIQPFCKVNSEAHFQDPFGTKVLVRNLRINIVDINARPPQATLARKMLNEAVLQSTCDRVSIMNIGEYKLELPAILPWFEAWRDCFFQVQFPSDHEFTKHLICCLLIVSSSDTNPLEMLSHMALQLNQLQSQAPAKLPKWFGPNILRCYVMIHDVIDGDNEKAQRTFDNMKNTYGVNQCFLLLINSRSAGQESNIQLPDPWSHFLSKRVEVQESGSEQDSSPRTPNEMGIMPSIVTIETPVTTPLPSAPATPVPPRAPHGTGNIITESVTMHPLSPEIENVGLIAHVDQSNTLTTSTDSLNLTGSVVVNSNVWSSTPNTLPTTHGSYLIQSDMDALKCFVQDFTVRALLPHVERQISQINDMITNKKGVRSSLFSATKRWFGTSKPGQPNSSTPINAVIYAIDSPELQLRRLGDLCFMFQHYSLAFQMYHSAKRDFSADQAWLHYAGALEMAALSAFMQGESTRKTCDYMEESINTYLNYCKMPQFATRATLLSSEYLRSKLQYGEAAKQLIRMTSEDSDLRSALLLEQAAYCFLSCLKPLMVRKYAFHIVLAGHRYSKAGQKKHSLRCYKQAYQVYESRGWRLAEDHINFTIGRQAAILKEGMLAESALARLLAPGSQQSAQQQASFLKEFLHTHNQMISEEPNSSTLPVLPLPILISNSTRVLTAPLPPLSTPGRVPATGTSLSVPVSNLNVNQPLVFDKLQGIDQWGKLEEVLIHEAQGQLPMIFKPTNVLFTHETNNTNRPIAVVGEPVQLSIELQNPFQILLQLLNVKLIWTFTFNDPDNPSSPGTISNESLFASNKSEYTEEYLQSIVCTQLLTNIILPIDSKTRVLLNVIPLHVGDLKITGIAYRLTNHSVITDQSNSIQSVAGKQEFKIQGVRLKTVKEKDGVIQYAVDKRLDISVVHQAPCLQVSFNEIPVELLGEELQEVNVEFRNVGSCGLTKLYMATSTPWLVALNSMKESPPRPRRKGDPLRVFVDDPIEFESPTLRDKESRKQHVVPIPLPNDTLAPGQSYNINLWLRAPLIKGTQQINVLFYYENCNSAAMPRYRLLRHVWNVNINDSIQVTTVAKRSENIHPQNKNHLNSMNYIESNKLFETAINNFKSNVNSFVKPSEINVNSKQYTLGNDGSGISSSEAVETLNISVTIKNLNQVHHLIMTEISLSQALLLSPCWKLENLCIAPDVKLQTQEVFHFILKARRIIENNKTDEYKGTPVKQYLSEIPLSRSNIPITDMASFEFVKKHKKKYINIFENVSISDLNTQTQKGNKIDVIEKSIDNINQLNSVLVIKWIATITDQSRKKRTGIGQNYINLDKLNLEVKLPLESSIINIEANGPLILFGPDRIKDGEDFESNIDKSEIEKNLITFNLLHDKEIFHNFMNSSVCLVPVTVVILNNSDVDLDIQVDTVTNMSVSTVSLTSGSASGSYRWVGPSHVLSSVPSHSNTNLLLQLAVGAPRAYDLGCRLSVLALINGISKRQACRVSNVLVVKQTL